MITLWSIFQSPLMYGGELADLDAWTLSLLTNTEVNEMHRTLEGQRQEYRDDEWIVWSGENKESTYIAIFNVSDEKKEIPGKLTERYLRKDAKKSGQEKGNRRNRRSRKPWLCTVSDEKNMMNVR